MSPKRPIRPEELRPGAPSRAHEDGDGLPQPAGTPDPPEVAGIEEAMVPTLSLSSYLALATTLLAVLPRLRSGRFLSEMMGFGLYVAPTILAGYASGIFGGGGPFRSEGEALAVSEPLASSSFTVVWLAIGALLVGALWVTLKSVIDTQVYSLMRVAVSGQDSQVRPALTKLNAFIAFNLLQLAFATGVALFLGPVVLRMVSGALVTGDLSIGVGFLFPVALGMVVFVAVRVFSMFVAAWVAWRPVFIAGAFGAAFAAPVRDLRLFWQSVVLLVPVAALAVMAIVLAGAGLYLPSVVLDLSPMFTQLVMVVTFVIFVQILTWFDVGIVASVGHQLGEFQVARTPEEAARMRAVALRTNLESSEQPVIYAARPGLFIAGEPASAPLRFDDVPGYRPYQPDAPESPSEAAYDVAGDNRSAPHGVQPPADLMSAAIEGGAASTESDADEAPLPWLAPSVASEGDARGFARLDASLLPTVLRSAGEQAERRFRGHRPTRARASE